MNNYFSTFLERLNELRGSLSVSAFASRCGIAQPMMDRYFKGANSPSLEKVIQICVAFGVSVDWLLGLSDCRSPGSVSPGDESLRSRLHDLEVENASLQKALALLGSGASRRPVSPVKTGGASATKSA